MICSYHMQVRRSTIGRKSIIYVFSYHANDIIKVTEGLQETTQLIEWDDGETCK